MKRSVFFVLCVLSLYPGYSQNLVVNPGFESWRESGRLTDWVPAEKITQESTEVHSGLYSALQTGTTYSPNLGQSIPVTPGKEYYLSLYFKTGTATTGNGSRIYCSWLDANEDKFDDPATKELMQSSYLKSDSWKQYSITVKAPAPAVSFFLQVRTLPNSITYWDDFVFKESSATGAPDDFSYEIKIYPVPADYYIHIANTQGVKSIEILDLTGNVLRTESIHVQDEVTIPVNGLKEGIYILRFRYERKTVVRKFVKG